MLILAFDAKSAMSLKLHFFADFGVLWHGNISDSMFGVCNVSVIEYY